VPWLQQGLSVKPSGTRKVRGVIQNVIVRREELWRILRVERTKDANTEKQAEEFANDMRRWLEGSYKYADVVFKLFSWLLAIGVAQGLWFATRYGLFLVISGIMVTAFLFHLTLRMLYFLPYTLNFILSKRSYLKETLIVVLFCSLVIPPALIFSVLPVAIKKTLFAIHCPSSHHDQVQRPIDCPVRPRYR